MFGKKTRSSSGVLASRVGEIAKSTSYAPTRPITPVTEKRHPRTPSFKPGTLTFVGGERLNVVVTNISATGARVEFVRGSRLPEHVMLTEPLQGIKKWAYVSWQSYGVAGLAFVKDQATPAAR